MDEKFYSSYFEIESKHWWFKVRRNLIFYLLQKYLKKTRSEIKLLDYGCGSGYLVGELQKAGYNAAGADFSHEAIKYGTERGIKNLSIQENLYLQYNDSSFDCILLLDVLEHIKDEKTIIKEIYRISKKGGIIIATVPAYMFLWGIQDEVSHHFRRYTLADFARLFSEDEFKILKKTYFNTFLFPPITLIRLFSKLFGLKKRQSDFSINNAFFNGIFYFIFNLEREITKLINFPFGVSILLVLNKK